MTHVNNLQEIAAVSQPEGDEGVRLLYSLSKEELVRIIVDDAKNWLAHDGVWFQSLEKKYGMEVAVDIDTDAWRLFTVIEAKRIMERLSIKSGGGIPALVECLKHRFYARLNLQESIEVTDSRAVFRMLDCRVQSARKRKGLPDHPCKSVGIVEYSEFARTVDSRIATRCIACPPDPHPDEFWCAWEFTLNPGQP
ncbi:hypothetical protein KOM00_05825 [Geomonas sp. Red69]|uniref:Cytosolic protein n=1 Tax=Geomonas diazotrophica TaxID=2843197 RepID=A0ABX8JG08_9BACT|nr:MULTISPECIES: DUF6125 family protein [Geomonas]MBU5636247.1 hypothetical protein [Geomonas diazotrophica]QWV96142.1 hypothetical protein KP005_12195 [Geomonas nitrogeniifigens]QXE85209.1 hypothetical protein KP003_12475 [Geomonas nitrogeniifigens]